MAKMELEVKFPCGYELTQKAEAGFFDYIEQEEPKSCPLHGKKCKKVV